jgi:hypothetical protein
VCVCACVRGCVFVLVGASLRVFLAAVACLNVCLYEYV